MKNSIILALFYTCINTKGHGVNTTPHHSYLLIQESVFYTDNDRNWNKLHSIKYSNSMVLFTLNEYSLAQQVEKQTGC